MIEWSTFEPIIAAISSVFTVSGLATFLAQVFKVAVPFVFFWWVARRIVKIVMGAINGGNLSSGASSRRRGR